MRQGTSLGELGHNLFWDAAGLLQSQDTRSASARLIAHERLMLQLAHQVVQMCSTSKHGVASTDQTRQPGP